MKKLKTLLLLFLFCFCITPMISVTAHADAIIDWYDQEDVNYEIEVTDPDGYVNIRSGPGTEYDIVTSAPTGTILEVDSEALSSNDKTWCHVTYKGDSGWLALARVTKVESSGSSSDADQEETTAVETETEKATETVATTEATEETVVTETETQTETETETETVETEQAENGINSQLIIFIPLVLIVILLAAILIVLLKRKK